MYLDPIQFLIDISNSLPIINFEGRVNGYVDIKVRSWIDKIEPNPPYISVDKEVHIADFMQKHCLMRVQFEGFKQLPSNLCASTYAYFKFFFHPSAYKTSRYGGVAVNPVIDHTVAIDQKITKDFVDFIKTGCIEIEVVVIAVIECLHLLCFWFLRP